MSVYTLEELYQQQASIKEDMDYFSNLEKESALKYGEIYNTLISNNFTPEEESNLEFKLSMYRDKLFYAVEKIKELKILAKNNKKQIIKEKDRINDSSMIIHIC